MRKGRLSHTRKTSREDTNKDLMTHLLVSSDPVLAVERKVKRNQHKISLAGIEKYVISDSESWSDYSYLGNNSSDNSS